MSPGRRRSRICDISSAVSTPPIWAITLPPVPARSQARIARRSGSMPLRAITFSDMRTFTPIAMSGFSGGIEQPQRAGSGNVGLQRLDQAVADPDVAPAAQPLVRIEHV